MNDQMSVSHARRATAVPVDSELREHPVGCRGTEPAAPTAEVKLRAVVCLLSNMATSDQEAVRCGVAEAEVERWRQVFIESGRQGLHRCGRLEPQPAEAILRVRNAALRSELRVKLAELRHYHKTAHRELGPFVRVEEIRRESDIAVSRFCVLIGLSRRTYFRRLVLLRSGQPPRNEADPTSIVSTCAQLVAGYLAAHPGYGHRRIHELMIADGHMVSASSVLRAIRIFRWRAADSAAHELLDRRPRGRR